MRQLSSVAASALQQLEQKLQPTLYLREPLTRVTAQKLSDRGFVGNGRLFFFELAANTSEREPFVEQQVLDSEDLFDVRSAIDARPAGGSRKTEGRKLRFPRPQHVGLELDEVADLSRLEQRSLGNVDLEDAFHSLKSITRQ